MSQEQRDGLTLKYIQEQCDGLTHKNNVMGCHLKRVRDWTFRASAKIEDIEYFFPQSKKGGNQQARLMNSDTCPLSFVACSRVLSPQFLLVSWFPSLCCTESEDSSDLNSENLYQQQPVFHFPMCFSKRSDVLHTVNLTVCKYKPFTSVQFAPIRTAPVAQ